MSNSDSNSNSKRKRTSLPRGPGPKRQCLERSPAPDADAIQRECGVEVRERFGPIVNDYTRMIGDAQRTSDAQKIAGAKSAQMLKLADYVTRLECVMADMEYAVIELLKAKLLGKTRKGKPRTYESHSFNERLRRLRGRISDLVEEAAFAYHHLEENQREQALSGCEDACNERLQALRASPPISYLYVRRH